jgi:hypothetical protein
MEITLLVTGTIVGLLLGLGIGFLVFRNKPSKKVNAIKYTDGIVSYGSKNKTKSF